MEQTEKSDNQSFARSIDLIASEYGWTIERILELTVQQLNLLIEIIGDRIKKDGMSQAIVFRMAIVAAFSKEGAEKFDSVVHEVFEEQRIIEDITPRELSQFGLGRK